LIPWVDFFWMDHPDFIGKLCRVDHAERIALERRRDLEHA
jgi:hypothetical protein